MSEYDIGSSPTRPCADDWCNNFTHWTGYSSNLYLQTTEPNTQATYAIQSISTAFPYTSGLVTCSGTCTNFTAGSPVAPTAATPTLLYAPEGFALSSGIGPNKTTYLIAKQGTNSGLISATQFTCDPQTPCPKLPNGGTLYVGDYLPDTIPFAAANYTNTIEVYFCDWEFAFNPNSGVSPNVCQLSNSTYSLLYKNVLNNP